MSPDLVASLLGWVELVCGARTLDEVVRRHDRGTADELTRADRWMSRTEFDALVATVQDLTGEDRFGRDVGLVTFRAILGTPSETSLLELGNVTAALRAMADYSSKTSVGRVLEITETGRGSAVLEARYDQGVSPTQYNCDLTAGYFAAFPSLFDRLGYAIESRCQGRGDDHCRFELRWTLDPRAVDPSKRLGSGISVRGISMVEQTESLHHAAAELASSGSIAEVLDRIVVQVSSAIKAPGFVLAVRPDRAVDELDVHSHGVDEVAARAVAVRATAGDADPSSIVAPITSGRRQVGHLVALLPTGTTPSEQDRRLLDSYARYAGSALEIVRSLEQARHARDTATSLLAFTRRLSRAGSADAVCDVLSRSMSDVIGCRYADVWLDHGPAGMVRVAGIDATGAPHESTTDALIPSERPLLEVLVADHRPRIFRTEEVEGPSREEMLDKGITHGMLLPLVSGDRLLGVATAAFDEPPAAWDDGTLLERAAAVADQAAVALANAQLTERLAHQAVHDELTGLPQRLLAQDRCEHALAGRARSGETVALLFLDLDGFKQVNDTAGHAVGDELLCAVARRLTNMLRASDTCARLGGDEFVVVLSGLSSDRRAIEIAERVVESFARPFEVVCGDDTLSLQLTTSVGVACARSDSDFEDLLRRSDSAMYAAKRAGRNTYSVAD